MEALVLLIEIHRDNISVCNSVKEAFIVQIVKFLIDSDAVNKLHINLIERHLAQQGNYDTSVNADKENNENRTPLLLQLLATVIVCDQIPIKRNQILILNKVLVRKHLFISINVFELISECVFQICSRECTATSEYII